MEGHRFDAWTRRRVGFAAGGLAATLLGWAGVPTAEAKKNKKNNNDKKKCRKLGQSCDQSQKNKKCCNSNQLCAQISGQGSGTFCCKQRNDNCSANSDCCGSDKCNGGKCSNP